MGWKSRSIGLLPLQAPGPGDACSSLRVLDSPVKATCQGSTSDPRGRDGSCWRSPARCVFGGIISSLLLRQVQGAWAMWGKLWKRLVSTLDLEMFRKGWWMLLLILGTIGVLFTICCVLVLGR